MSGSPPQDRPVTIYSVAERAGVSIATVSRVLQGSARTSPVTRQKVLHAVEELDYVPLRAARSLDVKRHEAHGLVLPGLTGPYFAELLAGFESTAAQYGQSVVVVLSGTSADLDTTLAKVRSTMCNCGSLTLRELYKRSRLTVASAVSIHEGGVHDVMLKDSRSNPSEA